MFYYFITPVGFILKQDLQRYHVSCGGVIRIHKLTTYAKSIIKYLKEMCLHDIHHLYAYIFLDFPDQSKTTIRISGSTQSGVHPLP